MCISKTHSLRNEYKHNINHKQLSCDYFINILYTFILSIIIAIILKNAFSSHPSLQNHTRTIIHTEGLESKNILMFWAANTHTNLISGWKVRFRTI